MRQKCRVCCSDPYLQTFPTWAGNILPCSNNSRYYLPKWGRLATKDPLRLRINAGNLLAYARNNPIVATDPSGKRTWRMRPLRPRCRPNSPCIPPIPPSPPPIPPSPPRETGLDYARLLPPYSPHQPRSGIFPGPTPPPSACPRVDTCTGNTPTPLFQRVTDPDDCPSGTTAKEVQSGSSSNPESNMPEPNSPESPIQIEIDLGNAEPLTPLDPTSSDSVMYECLQCSGSCCNPIANCIVGDGGICECSATV